MPEQDFVAVSAGADGAVLAVDRNGSLWQHADGDWVEADAGSSDLATVACVAEDAAWAVDQGGRLLRLSRSGSRWSRHEGDGTDVATVHVGFDGSVWTIDRSGRVRDVSEGNGQPTPAAESCSAVAVGVGGRAVLLTTDGTVRVRRTSTDSWTAVEGGPFVDVAIDAGGRPLAVDEQGTLSVFGERWEPLAQEVTRVSVAADGQAWTVTTSHRAVQLPPQAKRLGGPGDLEQLTWHAWRTDDKAWHPAAWESIDATSNNNHVPYSNLASVSTPDAGLYLFGGGYDGSLWVNRWTSTDGTWWPKWSKVDTPLADIAGVAAALAGSGLWLFAADGTGRMWQAVWDVVANDLSKWWSPLPVSDGDPQGLRLVDAATTKTAVSIAALDPGGYPWVRQSNTPGQWQEWLSLSTSDLLPPCSSFACAGSSDGLQLMVIEGRDCLFHTIIGDDGSRSAWAYVDDVCPVQFPPAQVACAWTPAGCQFVCSNADRDNLYHAIRYPGGAWSAGWGAISGVIGKTPSDIFSLSVAGDVPGMQASGDGLHVMPWSWVPTPP